MLVIILLLLLIVVLVSFKSNFTTNTITDTNNLTNANNILIMACHIKQKYGNNIINNNLEKVLNNKVTLVIIVYSTENNVKFNKFNKFNVPVVYIHDTENVYYDFYKYKLAHEYIKQNNILFNWVFVMNDSVIFTENVSWIIDKITESNDVDYIGILETNYHIFGKLPMKLHYQSWWLNFKQPAFDYWCDNINFNESHSIKSYDEINDITIGVKNIINDFEINLSNDMINKFKNNVIFPNKVTGNIFWNDELYNDYYNNKKFTFVKVKNIKIDRVPLNLRKLL